MASDFNKEEEMYPRLTKWLTDEVGCDVAYHVGEASFKFTPADKGYITDVLGRKRDPDGNPQYIAIEAKNFVRDSQKVLNQCVSSLLFCHKAYLALPKKLFDSSSVEVQERIKNRVKLQNVGLLLVLKTRVDKVIDPPSQRFNQRTYNEVGRFFEEQEPDYSGEEGLWSDSQAQGFVERLRFYAPVSFEHSEDIAWCDQYDDVSRIELSHPYNDEVHSVVEIHPGKVTIEVTLETYAYRVIETFLSIYEESDFVELFNVYDKKPKKWEKFGMTSSPIFEVGIPVEGLLFRFEQAPSESAIFNVATFLKNHILSDGDMVDSTDVQVKVMAELGRTQWQKSLSIREEFSIRLLHELMEKASTLLAYLKEEL